LKTALANRFGDRTDFKKDSTHFFNDWYGYMETSVFGKYSPELVVELYHGYTNHPSPGLVGIDLRMHGISPLVICYTWKRLRDEYQASKVQL
jgi:hypothetical protein